MVSAPGPREALDQLQRVAHHEHVAVGLRAGLAVEVRRLDDQRVAFPVPRAIAHVGANARRQVRPAVERDDARLVDHLVADGDVARELENLVAVVVDDRKRRSEDAARNAAIVRAEFGRVVEAGEHDVGVLDRRGAALAFRRHRRQSAVGAARQSATPASRLCPIPASATAAGAVARARAPWTRPVSRVGLATRCDGLLLRVAANSSSVSFGARAEFRGPFERDADHVGAGPGALTDRDRPRPSSAASTSLSPAAAPRRPPTTDTRPRSPRFASA